MCESLRVYPTISKREQRKRARWKTKREIEKGKKRDANRYELDFG